MRHSLRHVRGLWMSAAEALTAVGGRAKVLSAAKRLFQSHGYGAVSVADILAAAGAPKGVLYHHFPGGKAEIAAAACGEIADDVVKLLRAQKSAMAALAAITEATAAWLEAKDFAEGALIGALAADTSGEPLVRAAVAAAQAEMRAAFAALLIAEGARDAAAHAKASLALAALDGAIAQARAARDAELLRRAIAALAL